jgi:DNA-binding transcriptional LysR family regulator
MNRIALYHLETLIWIARLGTFSAAAERLNTTQPSVSARIHELEDQLGVELFRKEGRRSVLTVQGRDIVRRCEDLWASFEQLLLHSDTLSGVIRVGAGEIAAATVLPAFITGLQREFPSITFEIEIDLTVNLLQRLMSSRLDMIFLPGPVGGPGLRVASIGSIKLNWLASRARAATLKPGATPADSNLPIWSLPHHSPLHQVMRDAVASGGKIRRQIHSCNNVQTLMKIIEHDGGIGIAPAGMAVSAVASGRLQPVFETAPLPSLAVSTAIRANENEAAVLRLFDHAARLTL